MKLTFPIFVSVVALLISLSWVAIYSLTALR
jgi:hypothetical protein